jgi:hypothetical protein
MAQTDDKDWARGYARQALSDLRARDILVSANAEKCHRLHFLQMAAEKACKARLIAQNGDVREDNSEYPWEGANGEVRIPCEYNFPKINDEEKTIVKLIRLIRIAALSYFPD